MSMWKKLFNTTQKIIKENKAMILNESSINYIHIQKRKKNISLKIDQQGLVISTPFDTPQSHIESIIERKLTWILKHLKKINTDNQLITSIPIFGKNFKVIYQCPNNSIDLKSEIIHLVIKENHKKIITNLLKECAQKYFNERLEFYRTKINDQPNHITLTNAKTKWGSCSSSRNIKLSWRLIHAKPEIIDYVLCHELAHLKHMNHSMLFWKEVESIFPEFKKFKKELKDHSLSYFILD